MDVRRDLLRRARFAGDDSVYFGFYDHVGGSPQGVVRTLFSDPGAILSALFEGHDVVYLVWLGLPLLFLFVLSPALAAVALPQLLANVLSDFRSMSDPRYHSVAAVIPFLIAATVFAIARIRPTDGAGRRGRCAHVLGDARARRRPVGTSGRAEAARRSREHSGGARRCARRRRRARARRRAGELVQQRGCAPLRARAVYSVPVLGRAEWVVIDREDPWVVSKASPILTNHPEIVAGLADRLERDAAWRLVFDREGVVVFRRT